MVIAHFILSYLDTQLGIKMKKYSVTLDPIKCISYTLPDGRKFYPGRSKIMSESDIEPFQSAGVFLISLYSDDSEKDVVVGKKSDEKKVRFRKRKVSSPEINPDDKLDIEEDKEDFV